MRDFKKIDDYLNQLSRSIYPQKFCYDHIKSTNKTVILIDDDCKKILDIGCGDGYSLAKFKELKKEATGVSMSDQDLQTCKSKGFNVIKADMTFLPIEDNAFDCIWACRVLEHSPMPLMTLFEFRRVIRPGGIIILAIPEPADWLINHQNHYFVIPEKSWIKLFRELGLIIEYQGKEPVGSNDCSNDYIFKLRKGD